MCLYACGCTEAGWETKGKRLLGVERHRTFESGRLNSLMEADRRRQARQACLPVQWAVIAVDAYGCRVWENLEE